MTLKRFTLALGLAFLWAFPGSVCAQSLRSPESRFETALVIDARPLDAQVLLDGRPIGSARELVALAIAVLPGWHTVEIGAAGFHPYVGRFAADPHGSVNPFVVTLVPVR